MKNHHVMAGRKPMVFIGNPASGRIMLIKLGLPWTEKFRVEISLAEPDALDKILKFVNIAVIGGNDESAMVVWIG